MSIAKWGFVAALVLLPKGLVGIAAARQQQTTESSPQEDSLAAAARRAREQKKQQPKATKVWNNDDLPKNADALSVVGQTPPPDDKSAKPAANAPGATASQAGATNPGTDANKLDADLAAAKDQLLTLQSDLDILQRKFTLDQQTYFSKTGYSLNNSGAASLKDEQDQIGAKQQEISEQQKKIQDLQAKQTAASRASQDSAGTANQGGANSASPGPPNSPNQGTPDGANQPKSPD